MSADQARPTGSAARPEPGESLPGPAKYRIDNDRTGRETITSLRGGAGVVSVKFFPFDQAPAPAKFLVFEFPPGAGEGEHVHRHGGSPDERAYDEFYYVVAGRGVMLIEGERIPVETGDHVHAPLGVSHGIENTSQDTPLKVFLTYIARD